MHTYQVITTKSLSRCFFLKNDSSPPQNQEMEGGAFAPNIPAGSAIGIIHRHDNKLFVKTFHKKVLRLG